MSEDEPSWGGRIGTGKQDSRPIYTPAAQVCQEGSFKLTPEDQKVKDELESIIGKIHIVPNTGLNKLLSDLHHDIIAKRARLSPMLATFFVRIYGKSADEIGANPDCAENYVTEADIDDYYLDDLKEKIVGK